MLHDLARPSPLHASPHAPSPPHPPPHPNAPQKDRSCPLKVADVNITATNATNSFDRTWSLSSKMDMPTASYFAQVFVQCDVGGGKLDWCQADSTNNKSYWASQKIQSVTPAMRAAVVVGAIIGPAFLAAYFVWDNYIKKSQ